MLTFYLVKILAICTIALLYFIVLGAIGYGLSKLLPDDPSESIQKSTLMILGYVAIITSVFYLARSKLKYVPVLFNDMFKSGFDYRLLKEKDGSALSVLAALVFATPLIKRMERVRDYIVATY